VLPLVGLAPVHPPDAVQLWASVVLHCKVAALPWATLLFIAAKVTAGFAVPLADGSVMLVCPDDDP
jgi:hypothetical protein